jgi:hypothetical protein
MKSIMQRAAKPTPKFFQKLRNIGLAVTGIAATIIAAPVDLPAEVVKVAGYLAVAGTVLSGTCQVTVKNEKQ